MIIPAVHIAIKVPRSFAFIAFFSIIMDGRLSAVTAIMNARIVPRSAPFAKRASATGIVPKISAYIGMPMRVASTTPNGLPPPRMFSIQLSGIQLWITAPMATPARIYGNTFLNVTITCSAEYASLSLTVGLTVSIRAVFLPFLINPAT